MIESSVIFRATCFRNSQIQKYVLPLIQTVDMFSFRSVLQENGSKYYEKNTRTLILEIVLDSVNRAEMIGKFSTDIKLF